VIFVFAYWPAGVASVAQHSTQRTCWTSWLVFAKSLGFDTDPYRRRMLVAAH